MACPRGLAALRNKAATRPYGAPNLDGKLHSFFGHRPEDASFFQHFPSSTALGAHNVLGAGIRAAKRARPQRTSRRIDNEISQVAMPISRW
jgi:hypothetical protein